MQNILYLDLETTGLSPESDRIVELAFILEKEDGSVERWETLVNPEMPIPKESMDIHGITNEKVKDAPKLKEITEKIEQYLDDCQVFAGYNVLFDMKMLMAETRRIGKKYFFHDKKVWDMQKIFFHHEPRNLAAAYKYYCKDEFENAHRASADIEATRKIFHAQKEKYGMDMTDKDTLSTCEVNLPLDSNGAFALNEKGGVYFTFGKHKNKEANPKFQEVKNYLAWITGAKFPPDTKAIAKALLKGKEITLQNLKDIL